MKSSALQFITAIIVLMAGSAFALDRAELLHDPAATALLKKKCIRIVSSGVQSVRFEVVAHLLEQPDLILRIQSEYARSVSKTGTTDFPIIGMGDGHYHYINEKNQRTDIRELYREQTSATTFDLIYLAAGKRFFGKYEALIHIRVIDAGTAGVLYIAEIHAYPHNPPLRFFARRSGRTERYFQRKTQLTAWVTTKICTGLDAPPAYSLQQKPLLDLPTSHE